MAEQQTGQGAQNAQGNKDQKFSQSGADRNESKVGQSKDVDLNEREEKSREDIGTAQSPRGNTGSTSSDSKRKQ